MNAPKGFRLSYCDLIAHEIKQTAYSRLEDLGFKMDAIKLDLHPTEGYFLSTKKTIQVTDPINKKTYTITVEETE